MQLCFMRTKNCSRRFAISAVRQSTFMFVISASEDNEINQLQNFNILKEHYTLFLTKYKFLKWSGIRNVVIRRHIKKDNKIVSDFSQTQQYILLYFYLQDMFRSTDHLQAVCAKRRFICMQYKQHACNMGFRMTHKYIKIYLK